MSLSNIAIERLVIENIQHFIQQTGYPVLKYWVLELSPVQPVTDAVDQRLAHALSEDQRAASESLTIQACARQSEEDRNEAGQDAFAALQDNNLAQGLQQEQACNHVQITARTQRLQVLRSHLANVQSAIRRLDTLISYEEVNQHLHGHYGHDYYQGPQVATVYVTCENGRLRQLKGQRAASLRSRSDIQENINTAEGEKSALEGRNYQIDAILLTLPQNHLNREQRSHARDARARARQTWDPHLHQLSANHHASLRAHIQAEHREWQNEHNRMQGRAREINASLYRQQLETMLAGDAVLEQLDWNQRRALTQVLSHIRAHLTAKEDANQERILLAAAKRLLVAQRNELAQKQSRVATLMGDTPRLAADSGQRQTRNETLKTAMDERQGTRKKVLYAGLAGGISMGGLVGLAVLLMFVTAISTTLIPTLFVPAMLALVVTTALLITALVLTAKNGHDRGIRRQNTIQIADNDNTINNNGAELGLLENTEIPNLFAGIAQTESDIPGIRGRMNHQVQLAAYYLGKAQQTDVYTQETAPLYQFQQSGDMPQPSAPPRPDFFDNPGTPGYH